MFAPRNSFRGLFLNQRRLKPAIRRILIVFGVCRPYIAASFNNNQNLKAMTIEEFYSAQDAGKQLSFGEKMETQLVAGRAYAWIELGEITEDVFVKTNESNFVFKNSIVYIGWLCNRIVIPVS